MLHVTRDRLLLPLEKPNAPETDERYNLLVLKQCLKAKINNTTTISHSSPCGPVTVPVKQRVPPLIRNSFSEKKDLHAADLSN